MKLESSGFNDKERIPDKFTLDFDNVSPPLNWTDVPIGTMEFALVCDDPDAPMGNWVHWVLYGLPSSFSELPEGVPKGPELKDLGGAKQGRTGFGHMGYDGPSPPSGPDHRYFFRLYALCEKLDLKPGETADHLRQHMEGKILAESWIMGTYSK